MTTAAEEHTPGRTWGRTWGVRLVVAGLVLSILSKYSENIGFPISPDRPLIAAGVGLLFLTGELTAGLRLRWRSVHTCIVALLFLTLWSAITHQTLLTSPGFYGLLDRLVVPFALFALAPLIFRSPADRRVLLKALLGLGLYLGLTAIFEMVGPKALVFPRYILDPSIGDVFGRARGPLISAEGTGMILAIALFVALLGWRQLRGGWRIVAAVTAPVAAVGMVLTLTRSVWLGTLVGLVAVAVITPTLRRRLPLLLAGAAALIGAVLMAVPSLMQLVLERLTTQRSVYDRANTNEAALRMIADRPLEGVGWMRFESLSTDWVRQSDAYPVTQVAIEVHNVVLSRAAELGIFGAILWVACVLLGPVRAALHQPRDPDLADWRLVLVAYGALWSIAIMLSPVPYQLPNNLLWLIAGMVLTNYLVEHEPVDVEPSAAPADDLAPGARST